jgi:hypothetical protein
MGNKGAVDCLDSIADQSGSKMVAMAGGEDATVGAGERNRTSNR